MSLSRSTSTLLQLFWLTFLPRACYCSASVFFFLRPFPCPCRHVLFLLRECVYVCASVYVCLFFLFFFFCGEAQQLVATVTKALSSMMISPPATSFFLHACVARTPLHFSVSLSPSFILSCRRECCVRSQRTSPHGGHQRLWRRRRLRYTAMFVSERTCMCACVCVCVHVYDPSLWQRVTIACHSGGEHPHPSSSFATSSRCLCFALHYVRSLKPFLRSAWAAPRLRSTSHCQRASSPPFLRPLPAPLSSQCARLLRADLPQLASCLTVFPPPP